MWAFLSLALLFLLRSPLAEGASNFHLRNHTGALFLYAFDNGQVPLSPPAYVPDRLGLNLMGNLSMSQSGAVEWNPARQGVSIPSVTGGNRAISQRTTEALIDRISSEFTIEFFIASPSNPLSQVLLIAGFSDTPAHSAFESCYDTNVTSNGGWYLYSYLGTVLGFEVVVNLRGVPQCIHNSISTNAGALRHMSVRFRPGLLSIQSHDTISRSFDDTLEFDRSVWARHFAHLVLGTPTEKNGWKGSIYMLAMYDRYLSDDESRMNRAYGPPNSFPYCATTALTVLEDGASTLYP